MLTTAVVKSDVQLIQEEFCLSARFSKPWCLDQGCVEILSISIDSWMACSVRSNIITRGVKGWFV